MRGVSGPLCADEIVVEHVSVAGERRLEGECEVHLVCVAVEDVSLNLVERLCVLRSVQPGIPLRHGVCAQLPRIVDSGRHVPPSGEHAEPCEELRLWLIDHEGCIECRCSLVREVTGYPSPPARCFLGGFDDVRNLVDISGDQRRDLIDEYEGLPIDDVVEPCAEHTCSVRDPAV